ncbi:MAG: pyridoxamine 5'-phosphate oxidase family protein [Acidimicrobiia bacterium]|nr:pyridoxamine 5'-phosphate oxidase family protein [Acidimicrobiia bacterium]
MSEPTERTAVKRLAERGTYDAETAYAIIDEALICHVGFTTDEGHPMVIPTIHARIDDTLYLHGSVASRMLRTVKRGGQLCVTVTLLDGLVLARSHFHSSMNYRSLVILGEGREVPDGDEKTDAFKAVVEHIARGRWEDGRLPTPKESRATTIVAVPIDEFSAKIRTGGPGDDEEDYALPIWAGVIPLTTVAGDPIGDERLGSDIPIPAYAERYGRP